MEKITISLTKDDALVLFEWIASMDVRATRPPCDDAEQRVVWHVEGQLEKMLVEVVMPNYNALVAEAKQRILSS